MAKKVKIKSESELRKKYINANKASTLFDTDGVIWLPSRNIPLNWQLGGGLPYGRVMELFGFESTGKSLLAMDFCYAAQSLGGVVLWGDSEGSWTNSWAEKNGLNVDEVEIYQGNDIEGFSDWHNDMILHYRSRLDANQPILLVLDSLAAMECLDKLGEEQSQAKAEMGNRAKAVDKMYRMRNHIYRQYGVCVIIVNQVRDKIGASLYELAETTPGGKSTRFYASQRICLVRSKQIKEGDRKIGQNISIQIRKNKVAPPRSSIRSQVYFQDDLHGYVGYSRYHGIDKILIDKGVITKKGSRYYRKEKMIANGEDNFIKAIHENSKLLITKSGINTISKTRKLVESLSNQFPIDE